MASLTASQADELTAVSWISRTGEPWPRSLQAISTPRASRVGIARGSEIAPDPADQRQGDRPGAVLAGEGAGAVEHAWDNHTLVACGPLDAMAGDVLSRHPDQPRRPVLDARNAGCLRELGPHRPRADGSDAHPRAAQLGPQGLAEREDEGFGGAVDRGPGQRLKGARRRDVDDAPPPELHHRADEATGQVDDRLDVDADHLEHPAPRAGREVRLVPEAGVVDEHLDGPG